MFASIRCIREQFRATAETDVRDEFPPTYAVTMNDIERSTALANADLLSDLCLNLLAPPIPLRPVRRAILAVDIENSTTRTNAIKAWLRQGMYELVEGTLAAAGIGGELHDPLVDRGDGVLALIRQTDDVPITLLLDTVIPELSRCLTMHNEQRPERAMRLRVVLHAGEVLHDGRGCFGQALDLAFRLLDSPETRTTLRQAWPAPLALVVSEEIYLSVVTQGYPGIAAQRFEPHVRVTIAERGHTGWTYVPES